MNQEEIIVKLKDMYREEKSTKYVIHLIHSYIPVDKKVKGVESFTDTNNKTVKCSLSKCNLIDIKGYLQNQKNPKSELDEIDENLKGVEVAYRGVNTNSYLSSDSIMALQKFVSQMCSAGDKRINFVVKNLANETT